MHGNVSEWCLDDWHPNYEGAPTDGSAWLDENKTLAEKEKGTPVYRGGSWYEYRYYSRSASRNTNQVSRETRKNTLGFRVVCVRENFI